MLCLQIKLLQIKLLQIRLKKFAASTGFEPMISAFTGVMLYQLSCEATHTLGAIKVNCELTGSRSHATAKKPLLLQLQIQLPGSFLLYPQFMHM